MHRNSTLNKVAILFILMISTNSFSSENKAIDLGVVGSVKPIEEVDLRILFMQQIAAIPPNLVKEKSITKLKTGIRNLKPYFNTQTVSEYKVEFLNPSFEITKDILLPTINEDLSLTWHVAVKKGHVINPFALKIPPNGFFVFNPDYEMQTQMALLVEEMDKNNKVKLVISNGDILDVAKRFSRPIFYAYPTLVKLFELNKSNTLLYVEKVGEEVLMVKESFPMVKTREEMISLLNNRGWLK